MEIQPNNNADITYERDIITKFILNKLITKPSKCPLFSYPNTSLNLYNSLNNPYISRCSHNNCRKIIFLREGTIFSHLPRTVVSHIL